MVSVWLLPVQIQHPQLGCSQSAHKAAWPAEMNLKKNKTTTTIKSQTLLVLFVLVLFQYKALPQKLRPCTIPSLRISCCFLGLTCFLKMWCSSELWCRFSANSSGISDCRICLQSLGKARAWAVLRKASRDRGHTEGYLVWKQVKKKMTWQYRHMELFKCLMNLRPCL